MGQEAPRRSVPLRREEIPPILADEPHAEDGRCLRAPREVPDVRDPAGDEHAQHREAERELVDPKAEHIDARTKAMAFEPQHAHKVAAPWPKVYEDSD